MSQDPSTTSLEKQVSEPLYVEVIKRKLEILGKNGS